MSYLISRTIKVKAAIVLLVLAFVLAAAWKIGLLGAFVLFYLMLWPLWALLAICALPLAVFFSVRYFRAKRRCWDPVRLRDARIGVLASFVALVLFAAPVAVQFMEIEGAPLAKPRLHISPDGSYQLRTQAFHKWPPNELIDPSVYFCAWLIESHTGEAVHRERRLVFEMSDLGEPVIEWTTDSVMISGYNSQVPKESIILKDWENARSRP